jgi:pyocin large subunit-like protein
MGGVRIFGMAALAAAAVLTGCDNGPSAVAERERPGGDQSDTTVQRFADAGPARRERTDEDHRAEAPLKVDGQARWAATKRYTAEEGAQRTFERNGADFGTGSVDDFVVKAHAFVTDPPAGVEKIERSNGDVLLYDAKSNTFAVANAEGLPKTMFKPEEGAAYWAEQKSRESRRAARSGGRDGNDEG